MFEGRSMCSIFVFERSPCTVENLHVIYIYIYIYTYLHMRIKQEKQNKKKKKKNTFAVKEQN